VSIVKLKIFPNREDTIALITLCNLENPSDGPGYLRITCTILKPEGKREFTHTSSEQ